MALIEVRNLTKKYDRDIIANNQLSFSIEKGELVGLLGKNGAGKTTLLSLLGHDMIPDSGDILIDNIPLSKADPSKICVVQQELCLFDFLTVYEHLKYFSVLRSSNRKLINSKDVLETIKNLKLQKLLNKKTILLSGGEKRRVMLALALMTNAEIFFFDEPTENLDIEWRNYIIDFVYYLNKKYERTIVFSSHNLEEVEKITSKVIVLHRGSVLFFDTIQNILKKLPYGQKILIIDRDVFNQKYQNLLLLNFDIFIYKSNLEDIIYCNKKDFLSINLFLDGNSINFYYQSVSLEDFFRLNL